MKMAPKSETTSSTLPGKSCNKRYCQGTAKYDYDLIVLGGGSGGLAAAKEATDLGATVALLNYVTPTPRGTTWGLGGTCTNVGCIPKKLMHQAALLGEAVNDSRCYGWQVGEDVGHDWNELVSAIQRHIKSVNWTMKVELSQRKVNVINGLGSFKDPHTIRVATPKGEKLLTGKYILIAVGGRPSYPNIPGAKEYGITSDDLFSLDTPPGKTVICGAGYIGLECAGFLHGLGFDITIINRTSVVLRRCDVEMANFVASELQDRGVKFLHNCKATSVSKALNSEKLIVTWKNDAGEDLTEEFDTVMFAIGRDILTKELKLENAGVEVAKDGEKIDTVNEQTNVRHIYAVGDVLYDKPELTPVAIQAATLLARRIFGGSKVNMNYEIIATTVFTPLEYGAAGFSEETAIRRYGEDNVEVYHSYYKPSEFLLPNRSIAHCFLKVVALREGTQKVLGMHFIGPTAGEIIQGFLTAIQCGLTVDDLLNTVALHTTNAEEFTKLKVTKRSGEDPNPIACCN